ncbi:hypothetical protein HZA56_20905 [Candidatus Poribacteria bacterium]|nr:hypothetical protein [Candidatus Poribacteria bacterium]
MAGLVDEIREALVADGSLDGHGPYPERELVRALLMLINDTEELVRQRACWELGRAVSRMSESKIEVFIQRLLWRLNPESGDNPMGVPEALGEIGYRAPEQIRNAVCVFLQYLDDERLRPGLLQAVGRVGQRLSDVFTEHFSAISPYLGDKDPIISGNAVLALARISRGDATETTDVVGNDEREVRIYCRGEYRRMALCELVSHDCVNEDALCFVTGN